MLPTSPLNYSSELIPKWFCFPEDPLNEQEGSRKEIVATIFSYAISSLDDYEKISRISKEWGNCIEVLFKPQLSGCFFNGKLKVRLLIGEGNFSFAQALIHKHDLKARHLPKQSLGHAIIATELMEERDYVQREDYQTLERISELRKLGVTVILGFNATQLHKNILIKSISPSRIHWVCPFGGSSYQEREAFKSVMPKFFKSCSKIQKLGDRIYVTLMQEKLDLFGNRNNPYWKKRQVENPIVQASVANGYFLIRKRRFDSNRYPRYQHTMTNGQVNSKLSDQRSEFVFEKAKNKEAVCRKLGRKETRSLGGNLEKKYCIKTSEEYNGYYFDCSTDEDSSEYEVTYDRSEKKKTTHINESHSLDSSLMGKFSELRIDEVD